MLYLREVSDLHLEFYYDLYEGLHSRAKEELDKLIPPLPTDSETVLIVAGDLATASRATRISTFMNLVAPRFKKILYVFGNHEHYNFRMGDSLDHIVETCASNMEPWDFKKITFVGNTPKKEEIEDVNFLMGTLWTSYNDGDPVVMKAVRTAINDHRLIKVEDQADGVRPEQLKLVFKETVDKFGKWMEGKDNSRTVVVTHHMPSFKAVHPMYMMDQYSRVLNHAFASDLDDFILEHQPAYWFFGHTHTPFYEKIGNTQLHCNPLGYPTEKTAMNNSYDSTKVYAL